MSNRLSKVFSRPAGQPVDFTGYWQRPTAQRAAVQRATIVRTPRLTIVPSWQRKDQGKAA